jgi:Ala-tRNA(Pro) deacylase
MRVANFLADSQVSFERILHAPAMTANRRAHVLRVPGGRLAKCVLLKSAKSYHVAVLPATQRIDLDKVGSHLGGEVRLAQTGEISEVFRDCEWGALAPFGTLYGLSTLLEDSFDPNALLIFEAQLHAVAIRMCCRDFENLEHPTRLIFGVSA